MSDVTTILNELRNQVFKAKSLREKKSVLQSEMEIAEKRLEELQKTYKECIETREYYKRAVDLIYERSVKELKNTLNSAIQYVFYDRNFELDVELTDKRGKSLSLVMHEDGNEVALKGGMGKGINCVISAILHTYYLNCKGKKVLFLDEAYYNIDAEYAVSFFDFFYKLIHKLGFTVVLITHDVRFLDYGDKKYSINLGEVNIE